MALHSIPIHTDFNVGILISRDLSEAERRHVAPHSEGFGNAPSCVADIHQVSGEGQQSANTYQTP